MKNKTLLLAKRASDLDPGLHSVSRFFFLFFFYYFFNSEIENTWEEDVLLI